MQSDTLLLNNAFKFKQVFVVIDFFENRTNHFHFHQPEDGLSSLSLRAEIFTLHFF